MLLHGTGSDVDDPFTPIAIAEVAGRTGRPRLWWGVAAAGVTVVTAAGALFGHGAAIQPASATPVGVVSQPR
jgi:hypothetical protein